MSDPIPEVHLHRESTVEQVALALRGLIMDGKIAQGTYLREIAVARALGVSRGTVREATQILVREGIMVRHPHRGAAVRKVTSADVHDIYRVRRLLELAIFDDEGEHDYASLRETVAMFVRAIEDGDAARIVEADMSFHRGLVELLASPRLLDYFDQIKGETRLCLSLIDNQYGDPSVLIHEHQTILAALQKGDDAQARQLLEEHLDDAERIIAELVEETAETQGNGTG